MRKFAHPLSPTPPRYSRPIRRARRHKVKFFQRWKNSFGPAPAPARAASRRPCARRAGGGSAFPQDCTFADCGSVGARRGGCKISAELRKSDTHSRPSCARREAGGFPQNCAFPPATSRGILKLPDVEVLTRGRRLHEIRRFAFFVQPVIRRLAGCGRLLVFRRTALLQHPVTSLLWPAMRREAAARPIRKTERPN